MATDRDLSRRAVLTAAAGAGATALAPTASAQPRIDVYGMIPEAEQFATSDYTGFFIHVGEETEPNVEAARAATCGLEWSPDSLSAYDAKLIDRRAQDHREVPTTLHVSSRANVDPGSLYVINGQGTCDGGYVGLELEEIGAAARAGGGADQGGPGFGVLAGMAGAALAGLAGLLKRHGE